MKKKVYLVTVLLVTILTTGWILNIGIMNNEEVSPPTIQKDTLAIDDVTLDTFIRVYAVEILNCDNYEITVENREKIRNILASTGDVNIKLLKQVIFQESRVDIVKDIQAFADSNFMWEEEVLMEECIVD